jgi:cytochrome P450
MRRPSVIKPSGFLKLLPSLLMDPLPALLDLTRNRGDVINFHLGKTQKLILVNDPAVIRHILKNNNENYKRSKAIAPLRSLLGNGIFMSEDVLWQKMQTLLKPAFYEEQVKHYHLVVRHETEVLLQQWKISSERNSPVNVEQELHILMLKILLKTLFLKNFQPDCHVILSSLYAVLKKADFRNQKLKYAEKKVRSFLGFKTDQSFPDINLVFLQDLSEGIVAAGEKEPELCGSILTILIKAMGEGIIDRKQAKDEILNLIFAGFDTTAAGLTWTLKLLADHQDIQKKLRQEVLQHDGDAGNYSVNMDYTSMVIQEAMRLYPPVWSFLRVAEKDDCAAGYDIPAGSHILVCIYTLHRHRDLWERPDDFYPEHFAKESAKGKAFVYIPFGHGKRMCIGKPMAMMEMQLILPALISRFRYEHAGSGKYKVVPGIIIKSSRPMMMWVRD